MYDKMFTVLVGTLCGAGGFVAGALSRQPEINKLQEQIICLQADVEALKQAATEQNGEIEQLLVNYRALSVFSLRQRGELKGAIQDELVCQYASHDYLTLLLDVVNSGKKMSSDDIAFYKQYGKMLEDNVIDQQELEILRPTMMERRGREISSLTPCNLDLVFERIATYNESKGEARKGHGLFSLKK